MTNTVTMVFQAGPIYYRHSTPAYGRRMNSDSDSRLLSQGRRITCTYKDIIYGMLEAIVLRVGGYQLLGASKVLGGKLL